MLERVALRKTSLVDYPGRVASVLFLPGCNFRCPYCHNAPLVDATAREAGDGGYLPLAEAMAHLGRRAGLVTGLVLSGGEPLLHAETPAIASAARALGLAVKLDTNGSFPDRIAAVGADYVAIDLKTAPGRYGLAAPGLADAGERVRESLRILRALGAPFEIRITCAPGLVGPAEAESMAELLEPGDAVFLQRFRAGGCLDPAFDAVAPHDEETLAAILAAIRRAAPLARIRGTP